MNVAVTVRFALMVMVAGFADPLRSPLQPDEVESGGGVAVNVTTVPAG